MTKNHETQQKANEEIHWSDLQKVWRAAKLQRKNALQVEIRNFFNEALPPQLPILGLEETRGESALSFTIAGPPTLFQKGQNLEVIQWTVEGGYNRRKVLADAKVSSVEGEIIEQTIGPVVASFLFSPQANVKSLRVISLAYDIMEILQAPSVRIVEQNDNILIEVAHKKPLPILLEDCLPVPQNFKLPIILGKDTKGQPVYVDLARLPHLLVGGLRGKTNFLNHILNTQYQAQFYLIDDVKKKDWAAHKDQLLDPSIALRVIIKEMERRYRAMAQMGVRTIEEFNACLRNKNSFNRSVQIGFDNETGKPIFENQSLHYQPFSYQIVLVQELFSIAGTPETQSYLQKCCAMTRAAGIHFIAATKHKPSTLIQGTFPARLSFKTASRFESCFLIEGTEYLCPYGDALFRNGNIQRIHTVFHNSSAGHNAARSA